MSTRAAGDISASNSHPTPAVLYAAKSTEDARGSIPQQLADCRAMAERFGWTVAAEFRDEGFSAYRGNRGPGLEAAKARAAGLAHDHGGSLLIVQHTDRLARGSGDGPEAADHFAELFFFLRRANIRVRSVEDDHNTEDALRAVLIGERNSEDSRRKALAVRAGKHRRFERGGSTGPVPFGYRLEVVVDDEGLPIRNGERVETRRVLDPVEGPAVVGAFSLAERGVTDGQITRWLNGQGYTTKRGKPFGRSRVRELLENPYYAGMVRMHNELREGKHDAIVSPETYAAVQTTRTRSDPASRAKRKGGRPSGEALLSGVAFCGRCGHGMWHRKDRRRNGTARRAYVCGQKRHATGVCDAPAVEAEQVERAMAMHFDEVAVDFEGWLSEVIGARAGEREALGGEIRRLEERRTGLSRDEGLVRADYLGNLRAGREHAADLATETLAAIEKERTDLDRSILDRQAQLEEWSDQPQIDAMLDWWNELSAALRGRVAGARSVREANTAMRELLQSIYVHTEAGGRTRLDFILKGAEASEDGDWEGLRDTTSVYAGSGRIKPPRSLQALLAEPNASPSCRSSRSSRRSAGSCGPQPARRGLAPLEV